MTENDPGYQIVPFPRIRLPMVDGGRMGRQKHTVHGLVEIDVTRIRQAIMTTKPGRAKRRRSLPS